MPKATATNWSRKGGFTLVEVVVTSLLVSLAVVGVFGGISSLTEAQYRARNADLLQRLAAEKLNDARILADPSSNGTSGDFSDRGYPDISWTLDEEATSTSNLDQVTVTSTRGRQSEALTTLMYVPPATVTGTGGT